MGQYNLKRYRKVMKTWAWTAGGIDQIPLCGPFNELVWSIKGTTDSHTPDAFPAGLGRWASSIQFVSNKRGNLGFIDSMAMLAMSYSFFNTWYYQATVAGSATDGAGGILPLAADFDEIITMNVTGNTLANLANANLAGFAGTLRCSLGVINTAEAGTYWAYFKQALGTSGVIGVSSGFQQPTASMFPGFLSVGEVYIAFITALTTAADAMNLDQIRTTAGDDAIIDDYVLQLLLFDRRHCFPGNLATAANRSILTCRHIPLVTSDAFLTYVTNGATATIAPSAMVYIYQGGIVSNEGENSTKPKVETPTPSQPTAQGHLQPNVAGPAVPSKGGGYRGSVAGDLSSTLFGRRS